jgi:hypothetical protein
LNDFSPASSFLLPSDKLKSSFPFVGKSSEIKVSMSRLDDVSKDLELGDSLLTKIDVQGYENKVLSGGETTLKKSKIIVVEISFYEFYEKQSLFNDIYQSFVGWGFSYIGNVDQLDDPISGKPLQCDAIFIKN